MFPLFTLVYFYFEARKSIHIYHIVFVFVIFLSSKISLMNFDNDVPCSCVRPIIRISSYSFVVFVTIGQLIFILGNRIIKGWLFKQRRTRWFFHNAKLIAIVIVKHDTFERSKGLYLCHFFFVFFRYLLTSNF